MTLSGMVVSSRFVVGPLTSIAMMRETAMSGLERPRDPSTASGRSVPCFEPPDQLHVVLQFAAVSLGRLEVFNRSHETLKVFRESALRRLFPHVRSHLRNP